MGAVVRIREIRERKFGGVLSFGILRSGWRYFPNRSKSRSKEKMFKFRERKSKAIQWMVKRTARKKEKRRRSTVPH